MKSNDWSANRYPRFGTGARRDAGWESVPPLGLVGRLRRPMRPVDPDMERLSVNLQQVLAEIDWTVLDELKHIPRGAVGSPQEDLRHEYATFRTLHRAMACPLGPRDALAQAFATVEQRTPRFAARYDERFFFGEPDISWSP